MVWAALLAWVAGYVDAICVLVFGGPFAANMTGNLVVLGMSAAEGKWGKAAWALAMLAMFLAGVLLARLVFRAHRAPRAALLIVAGVIAAAGAGLLGPAAVLALAAAMATQNEAVTHGMGSVNVAFITGDMQKLGERLVAEIVPGRNPQGGERLILAVLASYALGAATGTLAARWNAASLVLPAVCLAGAALMPPRLGGIAAQRH